MSAETAIATGIFTVAMIVMVLLVLVWCVQGLARFRRIQLSRHSMNRRAFDLQSNARGLALLKSWLSAKQLRCYEQHGYFDVVGSDSGGIYRIHHGTQANIEQLDGYGGPVCAWCFGPEGNLVAGDVMLAQKIALETDERSALAIAVRHATLRNDLILRSRWFSPAS
jgi:hypothetical protein